MTEVFDIKMDKIIDYTLALQNINDIAMPIAVQYSFNDVVKDIKKTSLNSVTQSMFDVKKKSFFKANSGYKANNARDSGYDIAKLSAIAGITKSQKKNEKATEQVGNQQTATSILRSINPLGTKPKTKKEIDILEKNPIFYDSSKTYPEGKGNAYVRRMQRAHKQKRGLILTNGKRGTLHQVKSIKARKPTKRNPNRFIFRLKPLASYIKGGRVKLKKKNPFLQKAMETSTGNIMVRSYIRNAEIQFTRAMKRKGLK